jgi:hypothetical protein
MGSLQPGGCRTCGQWVKGERLRSKQPVQDSLSLAGDGLATCVEALGCHVGQRARGGLACLEHHTGHHAGQTKVCDTGTATHRGDCEAVIHVNELWAFVGNTWA